MPADYKKLHRLLEMITLMQNGTAGNAAALAERYGVQERTVYRDLGVIKALNIPVFQDGDSGSYRIRGDFYLPPMQLTPDEGLALVLLAQEVAAADQIPFTRPAVKAIEKLRGRLPQAVLEDLDAVDGRMSIKLAPSAPGDSATDVFAVVQDAIQRGRVLECQYESLSQIPGEEPEWFELHPYALHFSQRAWYVVGHHDGRGEVRNLRLTRFVAIDIGGASFQVPGDFSMNAHLGDAWLLIRGDTRYDVKIRFSPGFADTIAETRWHRTMEVEDQEDGSLLFTCSVEGLDEIVWWVLSMGPNAEVIEPPELRQRVKELSRQTAELYGVDA